MRINERLRHCCHHRNQIEDGIFIHLLLSIHCTQDITQLAKKHAGNNGKTYACDIEWHAVQAALEFALDFATKKRLSQYIKQQKSWIGIQEGHLLLYAQTLMTSH